MTQAVATRDADAVVPSAPHAHDTNTGVSNNKLAIWMFIASESLFFGAFIATFFLYRGRDALYLKGPTPDELLNIPFTSVTSFVLLMSSLTMVLAVSALEAGDHFKFRLWTVGTALLGSVFIAGQVYEFTVFLREGMGYTLNRSSSAFYTLTGFHGAHVTIGIIMLMSLVVITFRGRISGSKAEVIELIGLYWHFVDIVWIVIFTLVYLIPS